MILQIIIYADLGDHYILLCFNIEIFLLFQILIHADLGDNYIAGLFDNVNDPMTHATYADTFMKADEAPGVVHILESQHILDFIVDKIHYMLTFQTMHHLQVHEKTPDIMRPFAGHYDRSLKLKDWTDQVSFDTVLGPFHTVLGLF